MSEQVNSLNFPDQAVPDRMKESTDYGKKVGRAIEDEWFRKDSGASRFYRNREEFHRLRLYAQGNQSVQKYKSRMSAIDGDLSYLNLDWKPVPIIPKFLDIVVNGMVSREFMINAVSQDPLSMSERKSYIDTIQGEMENKDALLEMQAASGVDMFENNPDTLPESNDELDIHLQMTYKQNVELAEELAIDYIFKKNRYNQTARRRVLRDITTIGYGAVKHTFNLNDGIVIDYVDPSDMVWSYTEDPYFQDCSYFGEVKRINIVELKKMYPHLSDSDIKDIQQKSSSWQEYQGLTTYNTEAYDPNIVNLLFFTWKTYHNEIYKIKDTSSGGKKALKKDKSFDPPKDKRTGFERTHRVNEVLYEGVKVLGTAEILSWNLMKNQVRPKADTSRVISNYTVAAPSLYHGRVESLVSRMTKYADLIQLTHLKLQQVVQRMTPAGVYVDADGLAEVDLGNGTNYNPREALNLYFQTGSIIGRSMTQEGLPNSGRVPIQELPGGGGQQMQQLIGMYQHYLQMLRDVTGLNEARDGSTPDPDSLVGVQKLAAANSNTATRHILDASSYLTERLAEGLMYRISDVLEFSPLKKAFIQAIGKLNVQLLDTLKGLHTRDFGIFLELAPDEEEIQMLEQNIQVAISRDQLDVADISDIRGVKNVKLANQLLRLRRAQKLEKDQQMQQDNIKAQAEANAQAAAAAEQAKAQAEQIIAQSKIQVEQAKGQIELGKLDAEKQAKIELMQYEFELNMQLQEQQMAEARYSQREKMGGEMEKERLKQNSFESSGNDVISGGIPTNSFEPS